MSRLSRVLRPLLLIVATVVATEWLHQRYGSARDPQLPALDSLSDLVASSSDAVTEAEFERYTRVLEGMQADHTLSVEQAAERESVTVEQFREMERRVQRNDALVERVREALKRKAETLWDSRHAELAKPTRSPVVPDL